ncbi:hypothetical protein GCM10025867_36400 [Frondihabitans sucicola]|uniref:HTH lacI-type domain-containing protein n=1 Tax=Frondihabitans sucicola TaxID=1268041 RepID=A0ABN6Y2V5_9MICO|nr:LacI family DNA-binding transcriptional regulator [Frondihabitans sucicola]BDZ51399.1 hypothetical protein GCM10025867_36400 [Frondihabitans sucicola]
MATIYDVAEAAGVSPATVSRVFNGTAVSEQKTKLVRDAAARLKFTPNRTARTLRRKNSEVIALIIPDIENPYYTELARGSATWLRRPDTRSCSAAPTRTSPEKRGSSTSP